jgi:hypothetical protein
MRQCVQYWCNKCDICASKKSPHKRPRAPMKQCVVGAPWERMAIDILGPIWTSKILVQDSYEIYLTIQVSIPLLSTLKPV